MTNDFDKEQLRRDLLDMRDFFLTLTKYMDDAMVRAGAKVAEDALRRFYELFPEEKRKH